MTGMSTGTVHNHRIKTIESANCEEVSRLNEIFVVVVLLNGSLFELKIHGVIEETQVGFLHVLRHMRAKDGHVGIWGQATEEH